MFLDLNIFGHRNQGKNLGNFELKVDEAIFVGYATTKAYIFYNLRMNIVKESIYIAFDDKKIQGLVDEGNYDTH